MNDGVLKMYQEKQINEMSKSGELVVVEAIKTEKGLTIRLSDDFLFKSASATLNPQA